jgi:phage-related minor tail protein
MADDLTDTMLRTNDAASDLDVTLERVQRRSNNLGLSTGAFASAMTKAFSDATTGGKQFDDVLKSMALRLSNLAVQSAFKPIAKDIAKGLNEVLGSIFGPDVILVGGGRGGGSGGRGDGNFPPILNFGNFASGLGSILPFASGGVIGAPTYFPLSAGGLGVAGEAGPEAIVPLARGSDGRLGIAMGGAGARANITVQIAAPDTASFRRSEAYITGQIARAVARGQRSL